VDVVNTGMQGALCIPVSHPHRVTNTKCRIDAVISSDIRPKLVEKRNKHTKKNYASSWLYLQDDIVCLHTIFKDCLPVLLVDARNRTAPSTCLVSPERIIVDEMPI